MNSSDIRWEQRFLNFKKALIQLKNAVSLAKKRDLSELEEQGLIKAFEFTHELSWTLLKDFFEYQGITGLSGSRDVVREAFQKELIRDGEQWMEMIKSRNKTVHIYNEETAHAISNQILVSYFPLFLDLYSTMKTKVSLNQQDLFGEIE